MTIFRLRTLSVLAVFVFAALMAATVQFATARADTQYGPTTTGKSYRNNWTSRCVWWDGSGRSDPCYLGVWSDTTASPTLSQVVEVKEWADNLNGGCVNYQVPYCNWYYTSIPPSPSTSVGTNYATTNHYDPDATIWPSATRGYASHRDYSYNNGLDVYWTSDGF